MPKTLSVALITLNEAANLPRTLASVRWAAEIVVVDSGSTDATLEIAAGAGASVFAEPWKGFAAQKNSAISHATGDWVLSLDADEEVSPELAREIQALLAGEPELHRLPHSPAQSFSGPAAAPRRLLARPQAAPLPPRRGPLP